MTVLFRRSAAAFSADVGADVVALQKERGYCYGMEEVSAEVWRLIAEPADIDRIVTRLTEVYEVDPVTCRADVAELLSRLEAEGLAEQVAA